MKPIFKPKFCVPSQSQPTKPKTPEKNEKSIPVVKLEESEEIIALENPNINLADDGDEKSSQEVTTDHSKSALSDSQYDAIFDAVITKASSETEKGKSKEAAERFADRIQNSTPTNFQEQNEITPNTSPQEDAGNPPKLLLKKPAKAVEASPESVKAAHKRTSLEYTKAVNARSSLDSEKENKKEKKKHHRKHKSCSEISEKKHKKVFNKGVWVQCGERDCLKWRFLPECSDPSQLPGFWRCSLNTDQEQNKCSAPEVDWTSCLTSSQDHFVYTEYNAGSIVWAKMPGYPPWPAMVDSDPDTDMLYDYDAEGTVLRYHVVFLDEDVSRAWISARCIEPYNKSSSKLEMYNDKHFKSLLSSAITTADEAMTLSLSKRIKRFSFERRFKGDSVWTRIKKERKKSERRNKRLSEQVVPDSPATLSGGSKNSDYWETASDDMISDANGKENKKELKTPKTDKKKKKKTKTQRENKDQTKAPVKPTFSAPSRKPLGVLVKQENELDIEPEEQPFRFDSDIYTMEIDSPQEPNPSYDSSDGPRKSTLPNQSPRKCPSPVQSPNKSTSLNPGSEKSPTQSPLKSPKPLQSLVKPPSPIQSPRKSLPCQIHDKPPSPQHSPKQSPFQAPVSPDLLGESPSRPSQDEPLNLSLKVESPVLSTKNHPSDIVGGFWSVPVEKKYQDDDDDMFSDLELNDVESMDWQEREMELDHLMPAII